MLALGIPQRNDLDDYAAYIEYRSRSVRALLSGAKSRVRTAYGKYIARRGATLTPIAASDRLKKALRANYRLLDSGRPMAGIRDELLASAPQGICPMCVSRGVSTLDHYLPKSPYPEFAAYSKNLVPVCSDCNRVKSDKLGTSPVTRFLHAYFDVLPNVAILRTAVSLDHINRAVAIEFYVAKPPSLASNIFKNVRYHFETLKLGHHYRREAYIDLSNRTGALGECYGQARNANAVVQYLAREARSCKEKRGKNYWRTSLFKALSKHEDFCDGGFSMLEYDRSSG